MKNNKGFAITSIVYAMIILFLMLMLLMLMMFSSRKVILDKQKTDALNKINGTQEEVGLYKETILNGAYPELYGDLIAVTIDNDGTVKKADRTTMWYSYENKIWANAVILNKADSYNEGDIIPETDIESYFVWIPRYRYKIFDEGNYTSAPANKPSDYGSSVQTIEIVFEDKSSVKSVGTTENDWLTHPAFTLGNEELNGIWVGKFETSGTTDSIKIKPNEVSLGISEFKTMFETSYNYKRDLDSHMMKNIEWGAVAYLSHSKYGINTRISENNNKSFITGYGSVEYDSVINGTESTVTLPYNTNVGYKASTTGNISGIYDMSGGHGEIIASYVEGKYQELGFDENNNYNNKYFDIYPSGSTAVTYNNRKLGDATGELGPFYGYNDSDGNYRRHSTSWYSSNSNFLNGEYNLYRGGTGTDALIDSQFSFSSVSIEVSFRIVLTP